MLTKLIAVAALTGASLLALPLVAPQASPAVKPELSAPAGAAHAVRQRGGGGGFVGGGGRGFSRGMGGGPRFGGLSRGPRVGGFSRGPGRSFHRGGGPPRFSGRHAGRHHGHHHRHDRRFRGYGFYGLPYFYAYSDYDGYGCAYLRRRAVRTGSSYWWRRYEECRYGYEY